VSDGLGNTGRGPLRLLQPPPLELDSCLGATSDPTGRPTNWAAAEAVADDDAHRSVGVVRLLGGATPRPPGFSGDGADAPAVLVQFWDTGADMPRDVAECIASWDRLVDDVPRLSRVMFDDDTARQFIRDELSSDHAAVFDACRHPAMRCDYFRLCFLLRHGGLYVDADEVYLGGLGPELLAGARLKLQPLCYNIATDEMVAAEVFLEAARVGSWRELPARQQPPA
jgi:hypothetical protein